MVKKDNNNDGRFVIEKDKSQGKNSILFIVQHIALVRVLVLIKLPT